MVKIKQKKQLNLPQLIEWGFENYVTGTIFSDDRDEAKRIRFEIGILVSMYGDIHKGDTFTVEIEEEITEDTELDGLVELGNDGAGDDFFFSRGLSINDCKDEFTQAFYMLNDDLTMTLIWRDGRLVE